MKIGGRLIIPIGSTPEIQELVRVTRVSEDEFEMEDLADVRFVPLLGEEGWAPDTLPARARRRPGSRRTGLAAG